jgi:hypothetical protein
VDAMMVLVGVAFGLIGLLSQNTILAAPFKFAEKIIRL